MPFRPRIPKIYYATGIISLILLPLLCLWHMEDQKAFEEHRMISVWWWNPHLHEELPDFFPESHPDIHYAEIHLTGNETADSMALENSRPLIRKLVATGDTVNGVHFHFDAQARYWTLIKAFEICKTEKVRTFIPFENNIWVYNFPPKKPSEFDTLPVIGCGTSYYMSEVAYQPNGPEIAAAKSEALQATLTGIHKYGISVLLFTLLVFLTFWKQAKKKQGF